MDTNSTLCPQDWNLLLDRIEAGRCTPLIGAGASVPPLPLGRDLARSLAEEEEKQQDAKDGEKKKRYPAS